MPVKLFDTVGKSKLETFVDPQAIETLFQAIKSDLPPEYRSIQGMAIFFQELGEVFHHFASYAVSPAKEGDLSDKIKRSNLSLHKGSGNTQYLGVLIEIAALRAGMPLENPAHAKETKNHQKNPDLFVAKIYQSSRRKTGSENYFDHASLCEGITKNRGYFAEVAEFVCSRNLLMSTEELKKVLGSLSETTFKDYINLLEHIGKDNGRGFVKVLEATVASLREHPILCDDKHRAKLAGGDNPPTQSL